MPQPRPLKRLVVTLLAAGLLAPPRGALAQPPAGGGGDAVWRNAGDAARLPRERAGVLLALVAGLRAMRQKMEVPALVEPG